MTIRRDEHGVPYIEADDDDGAFFGLGFAEAQDRAFQIELLIRLARGTLAEVVGREMLEVDRLSRRVGFKRMAGPQLRACDEGTQQQIASFARGVNAGLAHGGQKKAHELTLLGAEPSRFEPTDTIAIVQFLSFALSSNWDAELARLRVLRADGREALVALEASLDEWRRELDIADRLLADADVLEGAERVEVAMAEVAALGTGPAASNAWVVAGSRTKSGRPIVASDPHLSAALPAPWYLAHLRTPAWAMSGAFFVTQPISSIGHNEHGAWALTAGHLDNTDLFVERLGADKKSVLDGGRFVPCEILRETIGIKDETPVIEEVLVTPRGPIVGPALQEHKDAISLRATWMAARPSGVYRLFRARDVEDMRACFTSYPALSENRIFADVSGTIAWQMTGDAPVRKRWHGLLPAPGWDPECGWEEEPRPYDSLPRSTNPACGFLAAANQRPPPPENGAWPYLGVDWLDDYRYRRIVEQLGSRSDWTIEATAQLQLDRVSLLWREVKDHLLAACAANGAGSEDLATARELLAVWSGDVAPDSAAASVFELALADLACRVARARAPRAWSEALGVGVNAVLPHGTMPLRRISHLARLLRDQPDGFFAGGWPEQIAAALAGAVCTLRARQGPDPARWGWGAVRPLHLRHPVAEKAPLDRIFGLPPIAVGGDVTTIPQASVDFQHPLGDPIGIANLRAVIDVGAWEQSRWSIAGGQSGNPCSPHFGDLVSRWERGDGVSIAWSREEVLKRARATLCLVPV